MLTTPSSEPAQDQPGLLRRLDDLHEVAVRPHAVVARDGDALAGHAHQRQRVAIRRCVRSPLIARPALAAIGGAKQFLGARIDRRRVVRRDRERRIPVPAVGGLVAARQRPDIRALFGPQIDADDVAVLRLGIDDVQVVGIGERLEAVAALDAIPVVVEDAGVAADRTRAAPRVVVLHAAAQVVGDRHVVADVVVLREVHVVDALPRLALVPAHPDAAVVAVDDVIRVVRVDPHRVMVRMQRAVLDEGLAAVIRDVDLDAADVDAQVVGRVDADLAEVHRPRIDVGHLPPRHPGIVGAIGAAFGLVLDARVEDVGILAVDVHPDAAEVARGMPLVIFVHVRPASLDLWMPLPGPPPLKPKPARRRWYVAA